jgi:CelD/BcsL family acetyltransferase involved in cellulose biosynthesis
MISKQRRVRVRKMLREKLDVGLATHRESQTEAELARDFERLIELHQKRRNMVGEPGCFASRTFTAFHVEFARRMLAQNKLYLSVTEMDGVPAAVGYDFVCGTSMYHYQSGFEPAFADERPGWLNLAATLRWAIERGITHFDMLRGDEPYKASFAAQSVPLVEIRVAGRRASAVLRHAAWRTQVGVKKIVRQGMSRAASWNRKANPPWVAPGIARESVVAAPTRAKPPVAPTI